MSEPRKPPEPVFSSARKDRQPPPRRIYKATSERQDGGYALLLDGRVAKTPAGTPVVVSLERVARALAKEWNAQGHRLDPATMPLTRIVNSAIDGVAVRMDDVRADIVRHAGSDLLCYRAEGPEALVERQSAAWSPLLAFAREAYGIRFILAEGIKHTEQDPTTLSAIEQALEAHDALTLAAVHTVTTLTGSAVIALALARGHLTPEAAWSAAHVDEDWQMSQWGRDAVALANREARWREMEAAALILRAL